MFDCPSIYCLTLEQLKSPSSNEILSLVYKVIVIFILLKYDTGDFMVKYSIRVLVVNKNREWHYYCV